ncbi:hypothetical protein C3486_32080 [Streptomyces sp. Ru73]|uniref:STAS domain-containing protein n=1 Tax=Streptomyces sp. Ru73 TaxID=2080748 RepID=UPI000CDE3BEE|nr:STAS domain-containing protein [Streptomyces sp. Ru73]POX36737.1 hypothetical protein C3486_32080 [Streptomyces sp. Ru73]
MQVTVRQGGDTVVLALNGELDLAMALRIETDLLLALNVLYALRRTVVIPAPRPRTAPRGIPKTVPVVNALPEVRPGAPAEVVPLPTAYPAAFSGAASAERPDELPDGLLGSGTGGGTAAVPHEKTMLIDLRHVTFMDCSGLDLLCRLRDKVAARGGRLVLLNLRPVVIRLLKLAALSEPFELAGLVDDASSGY